MSMYEHDEVIPTTPVVSYARTPRCMSAVEFRDGGYLQEVNRQFLHPLGLAMWVDVEAGTFGVFDSREDLEGWCFGPGGKEDLREKAVKVQDERLRRMDARYEALGYWIQHIPFLSRSLDAL